MTKRKTPGSVSVESGVLPGGLGWDFAYNWGDVERMERSSEQCERICAGDRATAKAFEGERGEEGSTDAYWLAVYVGNPDLPETEVGP